MALWDRKRADEEITLYEELLGRLQRALHANGSRSFEDALNDKILDVETLATTTVVPEVEWRLKALLWQLNDFDAVVGDPAEWKKILRMLDTQKAMPSLKSVRLRQSHCAPDERRERVRHGPLRR